MHPMLECGGGVPQKEVTYFNGFTPEFDLGCPSEVVKTLLYKNCSAWNWDIIHPLIQWKFSENFLEIGWLFLLCISFYNLF